MPVSVWLSLSRSKPVVRRASYSALIVGAVLILINHGNALLHRELNAFRLFQMALTVLVPYVVSTISSVTTIMDLTRKST